MSTNIPAARCSARRVFAMALLAIAIARTGRGDTTAPHPHAVVDLAITKTHIGSFTQGDTGKSYTIAVRNIGSAPTSGVASVTESLPSALTATAISGTGWSCTLGTLTCTRNDVLAAGDWWPPIVLTVNVASNASFTLTNTATVSGGGEGVTSNNTATDRTVIHSASNCADFNPAVNHAVGTAPRAVAVADFNGDGNADIASANQDSDNVSILIGSGTGTFTAAAHYAVGDYPTSVTAGDVDGDGDADLVVSNVSSNNFSILPGNGDGTFASAVHHTAGVGPRAIVIGDFNADGKADLAVPNAGELNNLASNNVSILLGTGGGAFSAPTNYAAGTTPTRTVMGDFNGDGKPDLAVANLNSDNVSILVGSGTGTFAAPVNYAVSDTPVSLAVGDFNGDGNADLAVANDDLSILLGTGTGTFAPAVPYANATHPGSVAVADFNGDGASDLALATSQLGILLGNGNGTFGADIDSYLAVVGNLSSVAAADFNNDGRPDLAAGNYSQNEVAVFLADCSDLTISKSHDGDFTQGQIGATYTLTVTNEGSAPTAGTVTVTDTLPASLSAMALSGSGWSCSLATLACSRSDSLAAGLSYPPITVTVEVSTTAPATVTNTATVSSASDVGDANNTASDETTVIPGGPFANLTIHKSHAGNFVRGDSGRTYVLAVSNVGDASTNGTVTVTDELPTGLGGLTATSMTGAGWTCSLAELTCTRDDALAAGGVFPQIVLSVDVSAHAEATVVNKARVSGGGQVVTANDTVSDPTIVLHEPHHMTATTVSATAVTVTWTAVNGATHYDVFRWSSTAPYALVGSSATTNFVDENLTPGTVYLYRVRAVDATNFGPLSSVDLATTVSFTDDPLTLPTVIKAVHMNELRAAVDLVRLAAGLSAATYTNEITPGTLVRAIDVRELREKLVQARSALGIHIIFYAHPDLAAGWPIKATDIEEIRSGVK